MLILKFVFHNTIFQQAVKSQNVYRLVLVKILTGNVIHVMTTKQPLGQCFLKDIKSCFGICRAFLKQHTNGLRYNITVGRFFGGILVNHPSGAAHKSDITTQDNRWYVTTYTSSIS